MTWTLAAGAFVAGTALPATDRGLRYGMSVFETFAVWEGRVLFGAEHRGRLSAACAAAGFSVPEIPAFPELSGRTGLLRIYVTAGDGGPLAAADAPRVMAVFDAVEFPCAATVRAGLRVVLSRAPIAPVLGGWKTGNYWAHVQAFQEAARLGCDEALVCNPQGGVVSAAMANLFVVVGDRVLTPPLTAGARDGVVRAWVREQIPVEEIPLTVEDLGPAAEGFLTNSRLGVCPIAEIEGRPLPSRSVGDWLAGLYRENFLRH